MSVEENNRPHRVRVRRWGKSPPAYMATYMAVRTTDCKTKYTDACRAVRPMSGGRLLETIREDSSR